MIISVRPFAEWADPDMVGQSEYRAIYDCCADALEGVDSEDESATIVSILEQFAEWIGVLTQGVVLKDDEGTNHA